MTIKIEVGRTYRTAAGVVVTIHTLTPDGRFSGQRVNPKQRGDFLPIVLPCHFSVWEADGTLSPGCQLDETRKHYGLGTELFRLVEDWPSYFNTACGILEARRQFTGEVSNVLG